MLILLVFLLLLLPVSHCGTECTFFGLICHDEEHIILHKTPEQMQGIFDAGEGSIDDDDLTNIIQHDQQTNSSVFVLKVYAEWCPFSVEYAPVFSAVAKMFPSLRFFTMDGSKYGKYNHRLGIHGFPSTLVFVQGKKHELASGRVPLEKLVLMIEKTTNMTAIPGIEVEPSVQTQRNTEGNIFVLVAAGALACVLCFWIGALRKPLPRYVEDKDD